MSAVTAGDSGRHPEGPVRRRLRARYRERTGMTPPTGLVPGTIDVGGRTRHFSIAPSPVPDAPMVVALHGAGGTGAGMAALTGLHTRGPAAGFTVVFPDGEGRVWNDNRGAARLRHREGVDDVAFLRALVDHVAARGIADARRVALLGISNGAMMSEHIARHDLLDVRAIVLVAGGAAATSRAARPLPAEPTQVLLFEGTADPLIPYAGGPIGAGGRGRRRGGRAGHANTGTNDDRVPRGVAVAAEQVAADWIAANHVAPTPRVDEVGVPGDLPVTRMHWAADGRPSVTLFRIDGGGHTWPGGAPYLPERFIGRVAALDATGITLDALQRTLRSR